MTATDNEDVTVKARGLAAKRAAIAKAAATRAAFAPTATQLAALVAADLVPFVTGPALSAMARWFHDPNDELLVVVVGAHELPDVTDDILAYALAWQRDRDLVLVLPDTRLGLTLERLPWIDTPVRVFTYTADLTLKPEVIPTRPEVLDRAAQRPLHPGVEHNLGNAHGFVQSLVAHLDDHWALVAAHRQSYLAWHCLGRQVICISRTGSGASIVAGVNYKKPPQGEEPALVMPVVQELTPVQIAEAERRVADAVWKRLAGHDLGHVEHRMQAALAATNLAGLGITQHPRREYPAWRGDKRPGFIDFLALDRRNVLHVVETKVGTSDVKGVLQTLDYAIWVQANAEKIRADVGWPSASRPGPETVALDFVLAPKGHGPAVGPYLAGQLEALAGDVPWRVSIVTDPFADTPEMTVPTPRAVPPVGPFVAQAVQGPRWAAHVGNDLAAELP